ncbi:inosine triphosphate pyrophosphatase-like protein [Gymnopilus junonius]|uniref:Inosine triphosphate pyrophosphatase-like protein n=1 Tax=Gymnopilus junonius TaxID=109634 RepID=A0A9P5NEM5_GYMJU|nr:inosine triphosphate pyrophosphatase-like protein [Gymnopilus junonius]
MSQHVLSHALRVPALEKLKNKRIVLASNSPRRKEILRTFGLAPDIVPSTFEEDLDISEFPEPHEYPVATATHKAVEVYEKLVREDPDNPPDLVIGADTVVLTHPQPVTSDTSYSLIPGINQELLENRYLNGQVLYPVLTSPGYTIKSIDERSLVYFADNQRYVLEAYAESGEGIDRAGGFAIQGQAGMLIRKIEGDYNNVVGFPAASFFKLLDLLVDEDPDFLDV